MIVIAVATVALAVLAATGWLTARAYADQRRLGERLDDLGHSLAKSAATVADRSSLLDALKGERAPGIALPGLDGERVTLDALLAPGKPLMLVFVEPRCGPCYEILPDLGGWQRVYGDRLSIALVSSGAPEPNEAMTSPYGLAPVLRQHDAEVVAAYGLIQAPAAVLVQPDGRISAGPRYGAHAIRQLAADTLGLELPPAPVQAMKALGVGDAVPTIRRPDLRGNVVNLAGTPGTPNLVLFWSPGCAHCQELAPIIRAAEQQAPRPAMTIVSRGPTGLTENAGFISPTVFDDDKAIARTFGVEGTPSAVVIDGYGKVASPVVRGEIRVRTLLERLTFLTAPPPARAMNAPGPYRSSSPERHLNGAPRLTG